MTIRSEVRERERGRALCLLYIIFISTFFTRNKARSVLTVLCMDDMFQYRINLSTNTRFLINSFHFCESLIDILYSLYSVHFIL